MAKKTDDRFVGCVWTEIDTGTLTGPLKASHEKAKASYAVAMTDRKAFDDAFVGSLAAMVPAGHEMVVSRQFGKLSFTIVKARTQGASKRAVSYLDVLAAFNTKK